MPKNPDKFIKDTTYTQNRETSWLKFNRRVLEEAADENVPLLERLKFIAIFTNNLDEFFMVRVGSLWDLSQISPKEMDNKTGQTPAEQLDEIFCAIPSLIEMKDSIYASVEKKLGEFGIRDLSAEQPSEEEKKFIIKYFKTNIKPILSPQVIDNHHPFPHLGNKSLYIAAHLKDKKGKHSLGLVPVPDKIPAFVYMPGSQLHFLRLENMILANAPKLFGPYHVESTCILSVTRNADISFDEEKFEDNDEDYRHRISKLLKKRSFLTVVRLEIQGKIKNEFFKLLKERIIVADKQIYFSQAPIDMKYVYDLEKSLPSSLTAALRYSEYEPVWPADFGEKGSILEQIRQKDRLLFFPFDSTEPFLRLLNEAAASEEVLSVKITIYRLASSSKIVQSLCRAAENGKDVTVLMELRARFDEANNIFWSELLENSGCRVIYGIDGYKCHSKICLITMRREGKIEYITQIGTGNYNEKTNKMYTDLSFLTASREIGEDGTAFFHNMLISNLEGSYQKLMIAPNALKSGILKLIERETAKGPEGEILIKINSLTERDVIDKLKEASCAGVKIQLVIRGICCLRPGVPGKTENIQVTSIVGRYLEHSRIYCFGRGEGADIYISSADLMTRNLNRRVEIACPIRDPELKNQLKKILHILLLDNVKAQVLLPDGSYYRKINEGPRLDSQEYFMKNHFHKSLPGAGKPAGRQRKWFWKKKKE